MKVVDIADARRKRDHAAVRIATAILKQQARMKDHAEALKRIDEFYKI